MFILDDLLAVPLRGLGFVLEQILTVRHGSASRSAELDTRAGTLSVVKGVSHVHHRRSALGAPGAA